MKKGHQIKTLCILVIAFFQFGVYAQEESTLNATIQIGRQGSDCRGRGICSFTMAHKSAGNVNVTLDENNIITLTIKKDHISENNWEQLVLSVIKKNSDNQALFFEIEEKLQLPDALKNELNKPNTKLEIPEGYYPISIVDDTVTIIFKLE